MSFDALADTDRIRRTMEALKSRGISSELLPGGHEALARLQELIPSGASVSTGASLTLKEIGQVLGVFVARADAWHREPDPEQRRDRPAIKRDGTKQRSFGSAVQWLHG